MFHLISFFMSLYLSTSDGCVCCSVHLFGSLCNIYPCLPSAPIETNLTPLLAMKSRALFTLLILWTLILPRSGLGNLSPACIKHTQKKRWSLFEAWKADLNLVRTGKVIAVETEVAVKMWAVRSTKIHYGMTAAQMIIYYAPKKQLPCYKLQLNIRSLKRILSNPNTASKWVFFLNACDKTKGGYSKLPSPKMSSVMVNL